MFRIVSRAVVYVAIIALALGCSDNPTAPPPSVGGSIAVLVPTVAVYEADNVQFGAVVRDEAGAIVVGAPVTWSVSDTTIAIVGNDGAFSALKAGTVQLIAKSGAHTTVYNVVIMRPSVQSVTVTLEHQAITRGDVALVGVRANGPGGRVILGRVAALTSANANIVVIDASGRMRAVSAGTTTIRATVDGVAGSAQIVVSPDSTVHELIRLDGVRVPVLVATDTVQVNGQPDIREVYLEGGTLTLSGAPLRYRVLLQYYEYAARTVDGRRSLVPFGPQNATDRGLVSYDARGDLQLASELYAPLNHLATPLSGGFQLRYRVPGDDIYLNLFFRRYPI